MKKNGSMRVFNRINYKMLRVSLLFGICGGIVGVLVDCDHALAYLFHIQNGRFLHLPLFVCALLVSIGVIAYCGRLYYRMVLNERNRYRLDNSRSLYTNRKYR